MDMDTFHLVNYAWIGIAAITFLALQKVTAPYGRHSSKSWGPTLPNKLGWILMEAPSLFTFAILFRLGDVPHDSPAWFFFIAWVVHYVNRTFIFPLRTRTKGKRMPILIPLTAIFFNLVNGGLNGYYLGFVRTYDASWLTTPQMIIGGSLFVIGMAVNIISDEKLLRLRKPGEKGYKIPKGWLFKYISCPNLAGEMVEWIGFAVMTWSLPGLTFALWTIANLLPRALEHHKFYQKQFPDYPKERKAVVPFVL